MLKIKKHSIIVMKYYITLTSLLVDWSWLRKESLSLKISQYKPPKMKTKDNKNLKIYIYSRIMG